MLNKIIVIPAKKNKETDKSSRSILMEDNLPDS